MFFPGDLSDSRRFVHCISLNGTPAVTVAHVKKLCRAVEEVREGKSLPEDQGAVRGGSAVVFRVAAIRAR